MSEQNSNQPPQPQRPTTNDHYAWHSYWTAQGQPWRSEVEIAMNRQIFLDECLATIPDMEQRYSFRNTKLSRADLEWLLSTYQRGSEIHWSHAYNHERQGLDLRGADLSKVNLRRLPLNGVDLSEAHLERADLSEAILEDANLRSAHLEGANLREAHLERAFLEKSNLADASLGFAHLERTNLRKANLKGASLQYTHIEGANLSQAYLSMTCLEYAHLEGANLSGVHLEGANLRCAHLQGSNLSDAILDSATNLKDIILTDNKFGSTSLAGVHWGDADLSVIDWAQMKVLGDELQAHQMKIGQGVTKYTSTRLEEYRTAMRANRLLATVLRNQGLNEEADYFAYRAQMLQREVWRRDRKFVKYIGSWFLYLIAGYGYRPLRSLIIYVCVVMGFAVGYYELTHNFQAQPYPLTWYEALILSVSSFHGRGFFQPLQSLGDPVAILASIEAVIGLFIEISFIATFTQRYFGR